MSDLSGPARSRRRAPSAESAREDLFRSDAIREYAVPGARQTDVLYRAVPRSDGFFAAEYRHSTKETFETLPRRFIRRDEAFVAAEGAYMAMRADEAAEEIGEDLGCTDPDHEHTLWIGGIFDPKASMLATVPMEVKRDNREDALAYAEQIVEAGQFRGERISWIKMFRSDNETYTCWRWRAPEPEPEPVTAEAPEPSRTWDRITVGYFLGIGAAFILGYLLNGMG